MWRIGGFLGLVPGVVNDGLLFVLFGEKFLFYIVIVLNKLKNGFGMLTATLRLGLFSRWIMFEIGENGKYKIKFAFLL